MECRSFGRLLFLLFCVFVASQAACQLRIATHNITTYNGGRGSDLQAIYYEAFEGRSLRPHVIAVQEFANTSAVQAFVQILNGSPGGPTDWAAGALDQRGGMNNCLVYRTNYVDLLRTIVVAQGSGSGSAPLRSVMRYDLRLKGYTGLGASLSVYVVHMKASNDGGSIDMRRVECEIVRADAERLPAGTPFVLAGDYNAYTAAEPGYTALTESRLNNLGRLFDPIRTSANWHNTFLFRHVHTQDPVGAGGMDDRFDQILVSSNLLDGDAFDYLGNPNVSYSTTTWNDPNHSYRAWGNDGNSFDMPLRENDNTMVGGVIARAIKAVALGAGHCPVFMDLLVPPKVATPSLIDFGAVRQFSTAVAPLEVANSGNVALWGDSGIARLSYTLSTTSGFSAPNGTFDAYAGDSANVHGILMDTSTPGWKAGFITVASNAPDQLVREVPVVGYVAPFPVVSGPPIRR